MDSSLDARSRIRSPPLDDFLYSLVAGNTTSPFNQDVLTNGESSKLVKRLKADADRRPPLPRQVQNLPKAADFFVPSLPGIPNLATHPTHPVNLYAGHLPSYPGEGNGGGTEDTGKDAQIYFMMAKARRSAGRQRVVFWFNGGPGCSSFDGSLMEVGPFRTVPASQTDSGQVEVKLVDGGWEEFSNIVFIDQPPGTGYSYVPTNGYLHELDEGAQHLVTFMRNFYSVFPELDGLDTFLAGESFAGQYIPYFADALIKTTALPNLALKGVAMGNGWIDPKQQYPGYADFAYQKGLVKEGTSESDNLQEELRRCQAQIDTYPDAESTPVNIDACGGVMDAVMQPFVQQLNGKRKCINVYDVRLVDDWPACGMNWPSDLPDVYLFLRRDDTIRALHAGLKETAWVECDNKVSSELRLHTSPASVHLLPGIIEAGVKIMIFAGAEDLICNHVGLERMMNNLEWSGVQGWKNATVNDWYLNGTQVGTWQESRNLTYAKILDASHMVGFDVPFVTNDMIMRFMEVDLNLLPGASAAATGRLGNSQKVAVTIGGTTSGSLALLKGGGTDWDAAYNAGSAILILLILLSIVALYFFFRNRGPRARRRTGSLALPRDRDYRDAAERVPLGPERLEMDDIERSEEYELDNEGNKRRPGSGRKGKGKGRAVEENGHRETVFALGDEDDV